MPLPVKLEQVQKLAAAGDPRAHEIYDTIGVYFGYNIATYADFYEVRNLLVLGRVMTGEGGDLILDGRQRSAARGVPRNRRTHPLSHPRRKGKTPRTGHRRREPAGHSQLRRKLMQFHNAAADVFVPDGSPADAALARTTHLCIAAHQDDIEIMAYHGIAECFGRKDHGSPAWSSPTERAARGPGFTAVYRRRDAAGAPDRAAQGGLRRRVCLSAPTWVSPVRR